MLNAEEQAELKSLCDEFRTLSSSLCKCLNLENPPGEGQIALLLKAEAEANHVLSKIKQVLQIVEDPA